jgi:hypothetical protein
MKRATKDLIILRQRKDLYTGGWIGFRIVGYIPPKKLFGFWIWRIFYTDLRILLIQRVEDLSNILARIVDFACNLVRILDCDFIVELLADPNLDKTIVGRRILLQIWADRRICTPLFTPPPVHGDVMFNTKERSSILWLWRFLGS